MHPVSTSLSDAVAHAVSFLTHPLLLAFPPPTVTRLQSVLSANLTSFYGAMWDPSNPTRYADRRCLVLVSSCQPPGPIHSACLATGIHWPEWAAAFGDRRIEFFVNPGHVYMHETDRRTGVSDSVNVWVDARMSPYNSPSKKTVAQLILEDDKEEDDRLFAMLAYQVNEPMWGTPVAPTFASSARSSSPMSVSSTHSRSSSFSSDSALSLSESMSSASSHSTRSSPKLSRRERANKVYVDVTKTEVTLYEAANTTVLSGGTMLGGPARSSQRRA